MIRTPQALIPYIFLCAFVAAGALWNLGRATVDTGHLGGPFALTDQDGAPRSGKDFHGHYVLLYFGYSFCPDVCPTTLAMMADALDRLGAKGRSVTPIFVTIDPARDTPKILKQYLAAFGPSFVGLTGSAASIKAIAQEYRVYFARHPLAGGGYAMDHSGVVYLLGPEGNLVTFYDAPLDSKALAADLEKRISSH
jgi:protein SCO1/2